MRLRLRIHRVYRVTSHNKMKEKKRSSGRGNGWSRVSKRWNREREKGKTKNKRKVEIEKFVLAKTLMAVLSLSLSPSGNSLRDRMACIRLLFPLQFFFQARESSDNENLYASDGYHWLWSHCGLDRSRSSILAV